MSRLLRCLILIFLFSYQGANAQNPKIDSLLNIVNTTGNDSLKANVYNQLAWFTMSSDMEQAKEYSNEALKIARKTKNKREEGISYCYIGNVFYYQSNYELALNFLQKGLKVFEEMNDQMGIANAQTTIGAIYLSWNNFDKALVYFKKALIIYSDLGVGHAVARTNNNIGLIYKNKGDLDKALNHFIISVKKLEDIGDISGQSYSYNNIGTIYSDLGDYDTAIVYLKKSYALDSIYNDKTGIAMSLNNIGEAYKGLKQYNTAVDYYNKSLELSTELMLVETKMNIYGNFSDLYEEIGDFKNAHKYNKKQINIKDSIYNTDREEILAEMQEKYDSEVNKKKIEILNKEKEFQLTIIISVIIGFVLVLVLSISIYKRYRIKKRTNLELEAHNKQIQQQKEEIETQRDQATEQRDLISHQKKEILDSIHYASKIQTAIMPPREVIDKYLSEYFILNKPLNIVSGDFYWITKKDEFIYTVVADCTGHGVPGAFMSMLGVAFINEIVNKSPKLKANEILNILRENVIRSLHQTGKSGETQDGMDLGITIIDTKQKKIQYSGANNPLYIFRENGTGPELIEVKGDRMPIGIYRKQDIPFTNHEIDTESNDLIYMFTDGYVDQFGGEKGKKFKTVALKKLLLEINNKSLKEQEGILNNTIETWMEGHEQIDDILMMGIKLN